jgi:hypothetical protein
VFDALFQAIGGVFGARWTERHFRRKAERSTAPWRAGARSYREVIVPAPLEEAEAWCQRALRSLGEERQVAVVGAIEVVTPPTRRSSGTVIRTQLVATAAGTRVDIAAWPGAQLFDWGASRRAVQDVVKALGDATATGAVAQRR